MKSLLRTLRKRLPLLIGVLLAGLVFVYALWPAAIAVEVARAVRGPLRVTVDQDGKTCIRDRYVVSAPSPDGSFALACDRATKSCAGQTVLAVIEPRDPELLDASARSVAEARVKAAESAVKQAVPILEKAQANYNQAVKDLARTRQGAMTGVIPPQDHEAAITCERTTSLELKAAQFGRRSLGSSWNRRRPRSCELDRPSLVRKKHGGSKFDRPLMAGCSKSFKRAQLWSLLVCVCSNWAIRQTWKWRSTSCQQTPLRCGRGLRSCWSTGAAKARSLGGCG